MKQVTQCKQILCTLIHPDSGSCCYRIKRKSRIINKLILCTPGHFGLGKKAIHWSCADKYILIEHSDLLFFDYGLSDIQDGLRCLRNWIYILWLTSSPCDKNPGERFRAPGPSCFIIMKAMALGNVKYNSHSDINFWTCLTYLCHSILFLDNDRVNIL